MNRNYTSEEVAFLADNVKGTSVKELTKLFNDRFQKNKTYLQISAALRNRKLKSGLDTRFKKGGIPLNKGKKQPGKVSSTSYRKGNVPRNKKEIGHERIDYKGNILIKVAEDGKQSDCWKLKHRLLWERENGPVPKGYVIMFLDQNKENIMLENLLLIDKRVLAVMTVRKMITKNAELNKLAKVNAEVLLKIGDLEKSRKKQR